MNDVSVTIPAAAVLGFGSGLVLGFGSGLVLGSEPRKSGNTLAISGASLWICGQNTGHDYRASGVLDTTAGKVSVTGASLWICGQGYMLGARVTG